MLSDCLIEYPCPVHLKNFTLTLSVQLRNCYIDKDICSHVDFFHLQSIRVYGGEIDEEQEEQFYLQRLEAGLFTLQLVDYIMLEACHSGPVSVSTHKFFVKLYF